MMGDGSQLMVILIAAEDPLHANQTENGRPILEMTVKRKTRKIEEGLRRPTKNRNKKTGHTRWTNAQTNQKKKLIESGELRYTAKLQREIKTLTTYWFLCVLRIGFYRNRLSSVERVGPVGRTVRTGLPVSPDPSGPSGIRGWVAGVAEVPGGAGVVGAAGAAASIGPELALNTRKGRQS